MSFLDCCFGNCVSVSDHLEALNDVAYYKKKHDAGWQTEWEIETKYRRQYEESCREFTLRLTSVIDEYEALIKKSRRFAIK